MNRLFLISIFVSIFFNISAQAQQSDLVGKWLTPDKDVIEFYQDGKTLTGKQISSLDYKKNNNKVIARDLIPKGTRVFEGTVIDPKDNKTYKGRFIIDEDGTELELKVKWGFMSFNETWKRVL
jgi:uncharacterized protein (DUF2147 family)